MEAAEAKERLLTSYGEPIAALCKQNLEGVRVTEREAALTVESDTLPVEAISATIGATPDEEVSKGMRRPGSVVPLLSRVNYWSVIERADNATPLCEVLERLFTRILPMKQGLIELGTKGCSIKLELVQWISKSDPHGPGFALEAHIVKYLAEIGAVVDVDQYIG